MMRENPLSILPAPLFEVPILSGPYLGRSIHEVAGPEQMKSVLQDNFDAWRKSPLIQRMLRPVLGDAILTAHGESWRRQRMTLQPAFLKRRLDPFAPIMAEAAELAVRQLSAPQTPEIMGVMSDATFAVIERVLFSDVEGFDRGEVRAAIEVLLEEIGQMRLSDLAPVPEWVPRPMSRRARKALRVFRKAVEGQISRRRAASEPGEDLLGLLLTVRDEETGKGLSDTDIRDSVMTFVAAGHETTGIALTWALYLLAHYPEAQGRLREQGDDDRGPDAPEDRRRLVRQHRQHQRDQHHEEEAGGDVQHQPLADQHQRRDHRDEDPLAGAQPRRHPAAGIHQRAAQEPPSRRQPTTIQPACVNARSRGL